MKSLLNFLKFLIVLFFILYVENQMSVGTASAEDAIIVFLIWIIIRLEFLYGD